MIWWRRSKPVAATPELELPPELPQEPERFVQTFPPYEVRDGLCPTCGVESGESVEFVKERIYDSRYDFLPRYIRVTPLIYITPPHLVWTCVACGAQRTTLTKNAAPVTP